MRRRLRLALARHRLRAHMFDRLIYGGSPDCPCARCTADRATVLELAGAPWDDPERARYYRHVFGPVSLGRSWHEGFGRES